MLVKVGYVSVMKNAMQIHISLSLRPRGFSQRGLG